MPSTPNTIPDFRRLLLDNINSPMHPEPDLQQFMEAAETVREAGEIALRLGSPELYRNCNVRTEMLGLDVAKELLGECLAALPATKPDFLSAKEVAGVLGCSERTVKRMKSADELPEPVQLGGMIKWRRTDIEAL